MRYIFKVLVLGNPDMIPTYVTNAFGENGEEKESFLEWYKEITVFEDICDLEVDVINDLIGADYDDLIPMVDGIIYFLDPMKEEETDFFETVMPIIYSVKRNIPTVIIYYDPEGVIPLAVNELLERLWINHYELEAFANLSPRDFYQPLQCLCVAMISGDTPLNIENAWMRYPIYIQLANIFFKNDQYIYAARAIRSAAMIADIFNNPEKFIISEQAAFFFNKANQYLDASDILKDINKEKSLNFKRLHAQNELTLGNRFFNKNSYEQAASQYLATAQWVAIELKDEGLKNEAFKLSITSWISACRVENAFKILDSLDHQESLQILDEIKEKIESAADFLIKNKNYLLARDQLYRTIAVYQREDLFDTLKKFTKKLESVLIKMLEIQIKDNDKYAARQSYDEIENLWISYDVKKTDIDHQMVDLIKLFLDDGDFGTSMLLTNKLNSRSLKKKMTELSSRIEDKKKALKKKESEEIIQKGLDMVKAFAIEEKQIIEKLNEKILIEVDKYIQKDQFSNAANILNNQAIFYRQIGKDDAKNNILKKALDILLEGKEFQEFFHYFNMLSKGEKNYLIQNDSFIKEKLNEQSLELKYEQDERIFENFLILYRDQMLYEQAKEISKIFIKFIKMEAYRIVTTKEDHKGIQQALLLVKKVENISSAYLEEEKINFDEIYEKIVHFYIKSGDFSSAHAKNDNIINKMLKSELNKKIEKAESSVRAVDLKKIEDTYKDKELKEKVSIIQKMARDALQTAKSELKHRIGRKRIYKNTLDSLSKREWNNSIQSYIITIERLINIKEYNFAGISLVLATILLLNQDKIQESQKLLENTKKKLAGFDNIEAFPIALAEYIVDVKKYQEADNFEKSIQFASSLPLFDEEILAIKTIYPNLEFEMVSDVQAITDNVKDIKETFRSYVNAIRKETQDEARRRLMKNQYWRLALEDLTNQKFSNAYLIYLDTIPKLAEKKFMKFAALNLILSTFINLKVKDPLAAKKKFQDNLKKLMRYQEKVQELPEIKLIPLVFQAFENKSSELIQFMLNLLHDKLILFEPERVLLESFLSEDLGDQTKIESLSRSELGKQNILSISLNQVFGSLQQKVSDIRNDKNTQLKKRKAMKRIYYGDIESDLEGNNFLSAGEKYIKLSKSFSNQKKFDTASLMILLHGLALMKAGKSLIDIQKNINSFLESLGLNRKLVEDLFYIKCLQFIIEVKLNNVEKKYLPQVKEMLEYLPLLDAEKILIDFNI
ncbi:MAG: hypothetical protein ACTSV5_11255 [Promethearchaeota archaeon]